MNNKSIIIFTLILVIVITGSSLTHSFALSGSSTEYGSLNIDKDTISVSEFELTIINISGNIVDYNSGHRIILEIVKPDNTSVEIKIQANNDGIFSTPIILDSNWVVGNYQLLGIYLNNEIGSASFLITSVYTPNIPVFSNIGNLEIDVEEITLSGNEKITVEVNGNIENYQRGESISLKITHPDGSTSNVNIKGQFNGDFTAHISIEENWKSGNYSIIASYDEKDFGQVNFLLNKILVPGFFKNIAYWWSDGLIEDFEFVDGVEFLINEKIIDIPNLSKNTIGGNEETVPDWIRQNMGWWARGLTSDTELVNVIQYLVEKGIIQIN